MKSSRKLANRVRECGYSVFLFLGMMVSGAVAQVQPTVPTQPAEPPESPIQADPAGAAQEAEPAPVPAPGDDVANQAGGSQSSRFFSIPPQANLPVVEGGDGFQLGFVDTDIATVVSTVIGDGLNIPYVLDPQVKGTITLQAARPLSREETMAALEAALRVQGVALVDVRGVLNVVPMKDAARRVTTLRLPNQNAPGFGIYIVPLRHVGVADMEKILQPFAPDGGVLRVDASRNLLLLAGTTQEIGTMLNVVATFDVDWLSGMSFALYQLENVDSKTIAAELGEIFSDGRSPIAGLVRLVPLARLNSLLVVTPQEKYLGDVGAWIKRLDVANAAPGRRIYVYDVQNGKADDLAKSMTSILSLGGAAVDGPIDRVGVQNEGGGGQGGASGGLSVAPASSVQTLGEGAAQSDTGSVRIVPNTENNSLLIMATPGEFNLIEGTLKRLDIVPIQVLIEASIAEVTLTDGLRFGLQWSYQSSTGPVVFSTAAGGTVNQSFPGFSYLYTGRADIKAVLNSLETLTKVRVLSSPKLLVVNNREAQLQIGDQVPIATQSAVSTFTNTAPIVNSVQLRDTGVILKVTPRANKSGRILLDVAQEVSNVIPTTTSEIDSPTIQQRKIASTVTVENGETIALGGLIREAQSRGRSGIPLLSRIPLLGALFGVTDSSTDRTELIVLLTPHIVRSSQESEATTLELQNQFKELRKMIENAQGTSVSKSTRGGGSGEEPKVAE